MDIQHGECEQKNSTACSESPECRLKCTRGIRWAGVLGFGELLKNKPSSMHADPLWLRGLKYWWLKYKYVGDHDAAPVCACVSQLLLQRCHLRVSFNVSIWARWQHFVRRVPVGSLETVTFHFSLPFFFSCQASSSCFWVEFGLLYFYLCFCQPYNRWLRSGSNRHGEHNTTEEHAWSRACWDGATHTARLAVTAEWAGVLSGAGAHNCFWFGCLVSGGMLYL